jgi:hypothetical protein
MSTIEQILNKDKFIIADLQIKAKELKINGYTKMKRTELINIITDNVNHPKQIKKSIPMKKKTIPKTLKNQIWDKYIGRDMGIGECYCCQKDIDSKHFEAGHVISESKGGDICIKNLRPVCDLCNKSMGVMNMNEFKNIVQENNTRSVVRELFKEYKFVNEQPCIKWTKKQNNNLYFDGVQNKAHGMFGYGDDTRHALGIRGEGQWESKSNHDDLINAFNYDNLKISKLTKLWCNYDDLLKLGTVHSLDKYDIGKTILEKQNKDDFSRNITELDTNFVLVDIYKLTEFIKIQL